MDDSLKGAGSAQGKKKGGGKLMGLPTYVWIGAIAAGLLLGLYLRSKGSGSSSSTAAATPAVDTSSVPASFDSGGSGDAFTGLSGSSVGGSTAASTDNGMSDLLNSLAVQSMDIEALTAQLGSLSSLPTANVASSGGSGAGTGHKPHRPVKKTPAHHKQQKTEHKRQKAHHRKVKAG